MTGGAAMDGRALRETAMAAAGELPGATHEFPFGPETDVFKVIGRVFLITGGSADDPMVTLKCDPDESVELRRELTTITPGYHMNKKHWISVAAGPGIVAGLVEELVIDSYLLASKGLPRSRRPVLPDDLRRR